MSISKSDFKIIFNKMINYDNQTINKYINNLSLNGNTSDEQIDKIIENYNSSYILRIIKNINNKIHIGGASPNNMVKDITIVDSNNSTIRKVPVAPSKKPQNIPSRRLKDTFSRRFDDTSSDDYGILKPTAFMQDDSVTSSEIPQNIPSRRLDDTSSDDYSGTTILTEIPVPVPVTKSELSEIFLPKKKKESNLKMSVEKLIDKLKLKSKLLKEKEIKLKYKETEINSRQKKIVQSEDDSKLKLDDINKQINDLKKQKEQFVIEIEDLKNKYCKLNDSISEIEVDTNNDLSLIETDSNPIQSLLEKIFS